MRVLEFTIELTKLLHATESTLTTYRNSISLIDFFPELAHEEILQLARNSEGCVLSYQPHRLVEEASGQELRDERARDAETALVWIHLYDDFYDTHSYHTIAIAHPITESKSKSIRFQGI